MPAFGALQLRAITREQVKAFAGRLQPGVAPTTARAIVFTLAAVLREAVDDGRIARNPAERVKVGAKTERAVDPMHISGVATRVPAIAEAMHPTLAGCRVADGVDRVAPGGVLRVYCRPCRLVASHDPCRSSDRQGGWE